MAFSAHKMCGPTGIGALLVADDAFRNAAIYGRRI